jgi:hypothetical protein
MCNSDVACQDLIRIFILKIGNFPAPLRSFFPFFL